MGGWATGACDCSWTSTESYFKIMYQVNDKDEIFFGFIRVSTEKNNDSFSEKWTFQKKQFDSLICQNNGEKLRFAPYVE